MRLSIKAKQVLGVTSTVGAVVIALSVYQLATLARVSLEESRVRGRLISRAIFQRAYAVVPRAADPHAVLRDDGGLQSILEASIYAPDVTDAAIVDVRNVIVAHYDRSRIGRPLPPRPDIGRLLLDLNGLELVWFIFNDTGRNFEVREPLKLGDQEFGAIRVGISTLLVRETLTEALGRQLGTAFGALIIATGVAMLLAQLFLRPIHVLKSGLTRLQRGETGITFDLPKDEFGDLGTFFSAVSEKLSTDRSQLAGQKANLETVVERLEDAVAIFSTRGEMLFGNPAMRLLAASPAGEPSEAEPWRELVQTTLATRQSQGPVSVRVPHSTGGPEPHGDAGTVEWLLITHLIDDVDHRPIGVMLIARNIDYLGQVQSTLRYSRKLTALGRLSAGVAHEVKNPLNAMMIHLELLRQKLLAAQQGVPGPLRIAAARPTSILPLDDRKVDLSGALDHVTVISGEIRRLDQVLQGFLKFTRPEDLRLQPVAPASLIAEVGQVVEPEARARGVRVEIVDGRTDLPFISGDAAMLRQAVLNLALNACQAMTHGGVLRLSARPAAHRRVELRVEDTGVGIKPEHLQRIFDLYFTTREKGSGIGLSMVYRTVQLHDGEIEVQSTPGVGTTFRVLLPQASGRTRGGVVEQQGGGDAS